MKTFKGEPNLLVRFNPPIGNIKHVRFNADGEFTTGNERVIKRFEHKYDSVPYKAEEKMYNCKKCDYETANKGELMSHYRAEHPKED